MYQNETLFLFDTELIQGTTEIMELYSSKSGTDIAYKCNAVVSFSRLKCNDGISLNRKK